MPASTPQPITEVAKPVIVVAACSAHLRLSAVTISAVARMPKASANVSSMVTPLISMGRAPDICLASGAKGNARLGVSEKHHGAHATSANG